MLTCTVCGHATTTDYVALADACPSCKTQPFPDAPISEHATFTLDAQTADGAYATDHGLTAREVANARRSAPKLGVTILRVIREDTPTLTPEQLAAAFGGPARH